MTLVGYISVPKAEEHAVESDGEGRVVRGCCGKGWECYGCGGAWEDCERIVGGGCVDP